MMKRPAINFRFMFRRTWLKVYIFGKRIQIFLHETLSEPTESADFPPVPKRTTSKNDGDEKSDACFSSGLFPRRVTTTTLGPFTERLLSFHLAPKMLNIVVSCSFFTCFFAFQTPSWP